MIDDKKLQQFLGKMLVDLGAGARSSRLLGGAAAASPLAAPVRGRGNRRNALIGQFMKTVIAAQGYPTRTIRVITNVSASKSNAGVAILI